MGDGNVEWHKVFTGDGKPIPPSTGPEARRAPDFVSVPTLNSPDGYVASEELRDAVNVAILLGQPLLLTGEPGTGKTQLADRLAREMGQGEPLTFIARTTSVANDLFYSYDALRRFLDVQNRDAKAADPANYVTYQALGLAILLAMPPELSKGYLPNAYKGQAGRRPVVLIDEIDKAPRDLPNDILNEVERMEFLVKETAARFPDFPTAARRLRQPGLTAVAREAKIQEWEDCFNANRPILILTSNDEKRLPDAFLRRCVYYYIGFPDPDTPQGQATLHDIIDNRMPPDKFDRSLLNPAYVNTVLARFKQIRGLLVDKKPATAELIGWMRLLETTGIVKEVLTGEKKPQGKEWQALLTSAVVLAKSNEDRRKIEQFLKNLPDNRLPAAQQNASTTS